MMTEEAALMGPGCTVAGKGLPAMGVPESDRLMLMLPACKELQNEPARALAAIS